MSYRRGIFLTGIRFNRDQASKFLKKNRLFLVLFVFWATLWALLGSLGIHGILNQYVEGPIAFRLRERTNNGLLLSPQIKIFSFDDKTIAYFGSPILPASLVPKLLSLFDQASPSAIIIGAVMSTYPQETDQTQSEIKSIRNLKTKIVAGTMIVQDPIRYRTPLEQAEFPKSWFWPHQVDDAARLPSAFIYGPEKTFRGVFSHLGHLNLPSTHEFYPLIYTQEDIAVPNLGLMAAQSLVVHNRKLYVDGKALNLRHDGTLPINFLAPQKIAENSWSLLGILQNIDHAGIDRMVQPGDVVVLLPAFGSGASDRLSSPFGSIPASYFLISILSSAMHGRWLSKIEPHWLTMLVCCTLGAFMAWRLSTRYFWSTLVASCVLCFFISQFLFIKMELLVSWLGPMAATTGAALLAFAEKSKRESKRRIFLEMEMHTASVLQKEFLPPANQTHPHYQIEVFYQAAEAVGGDWYSYHLRQNRWLYLHIGDVTGHGASAALLASYVKGAIDALHQTVPPVAGEVPALGRIHDEVNGILRKNGSDRLYLTLLSAVIDLESGDIWCLNSAHPSGVILDQEEKRSHLFSATGSPILGFTDKFDQVHIQHRRLHDGDYVILFTDGVFLKERSFLKARHTRQIMDTLMAGWIHSPKELGFFMLKSLQNKQKSDRPIEDDITVLILKYENKPTVVKDFSPAKTA